MCINCEYSKEKFSSFKLYDKYTTHDNISRNTHCEFIVHKFLYIQKGQTKIKFCTPPPRLKDN